MSRSANKKLVKLFVAILALGITIYSSIQSYLSYRDTKELRYSLLSVEEEPIINVKFDSVLVLQLDLYREENHTRFFNMKFKNRFILRNESSKNATMIFYDAIQSPSTPLPRNPYYYFVNKFNRGNSIKDFTVMNYFPPSREEPIILEGIAQTDDNYHLFFHLFILYKNSYNIFYYTLASFSFEYIKYDIKKNSEDGQIISTNHLKLINSKWYNKLLNEEEIEYLKGSKYFNKIKYD